MLPVDLSPLSNGQHDLVLTPEPEALDLDPEAFSDIEVHARLDYHNYDVQHRRLVVRLGASATARLECDRTLAPYEERISGEHTALFSATADPEDEEVTLLGPDEQAVDLAEAVRETLLLALPMRRVAPEARDLPIDTTFGAHTDPDGTPIDPRWEALRSLRNPS
jgi:uncharacterized protein